MNGLYHHTSCTKYPLTVNIHSAMKKKSALPRALVAAALPGLFVTLSKELSKAVWGQIVSASAEKLPQRQNAGKLKKKIPMGQNNKH